MNTVFPIDARVQPRNGAGAGGAGAGGQVGALLRIEAAAELVLAVLVYRQLGGAWLLFALLFLVPDLSMLGYLVNRRLGATLYNAGHSYVGPALLAAAGFMLGIPRAYLPASIWAAHVAFDRMLGYGLKYPSHFGATHLTWRSPRPGRT